MMENGQKNPSCHRDPSLHREKLEGLRNHHVNGI